MTPVKNPIVPLNPFPPYQPSNFCAPCAKITIPTVTRKVKLTHDSSVSNSADMSNLPSSLSHSARCVMSRRLDHVIHKEGQHHQRDAQ
jgi:hypothetical protein